MKKKIVVLGILLAVSCGSASGVQIFDPCYVAETYISYSHAMQSSGGMTFDSDGNMYVTYRGGGTIDRITPDKNVTTFATGLLEPRDIFWAGGTDYGNYLYVADHAGSGLGKIARVDLSGNVTTFASLNSPQGVEIDRVGSYGGFLYTGPRVSDHIDRI